MTRRDISPAAPASEEIAVEPILTLNSQRGVIWPPRMLAAGEDGEVMLLSMGADGATQVGVDVDVQEQIELAATLLGGRPSEVPIAVWGLAMALLAVWGRTLQRQGLDGLVSSNGELAEVAS